MFEKLVVAVDEDGPGADALALARLLAAPGARVVKLGRREGLATPSTGARLHAVAEEIDADLIVVGSASRGRLGRVFLGDTTGQALNGASCAVAVAPSGYAQQSRELEEIGVAFDGSPESLHAIDVARGLADQAGAVLSAFTAVEVPSYASAAASSPTIRWLARDELLCARMEIAALGDDVVPHAACGEPVRQLAIYSDSVDLLVTGSRGYGPVGRLIHGSTSMRLSRVARCPLLILTRPECGFPAGAQGIPASAQRLSPEGTRPLQRQH